MEFLFEILFELLASGLLELLAEIPLSGRKTRQKRENHHPILASFGYLVLGGALGALLAWLVPGRALPWSGIPGSSLVLSPLGAGLLMEWWGRRRRAGGHATTNLATWYGGAAFALGSALARYLLVR